MSFAEIAAQLGYPSENAANKSVLSALRREVHEGANQLRTLEGLRLDEMQTGLWSKATGGDVGAVMAVIKIMEARAGPSGTPAWLVPGPEGP